MGISFVFALFVCLIVALFWYRKKSSKSTEDISNTTVILDPYDQSELLPDAVDVSIKMGNNELRVKTNKINVNKIKRHGLPLKSRSFIKGNSYKIAYLTSSNIYNTIPDLVEWWNVATLYNILTDNDNFEPIYGFNQFEGYGGGETDGAGAGGSWDSQDNNQNIGNDIQQNAPIIDDNPINTTPIVDDNNTEDNQSNQDTEDIGNFS